MSRYLIACAIAVALAASCAKPSTIPPVQSALASHSALLAQAGAE